MYINTDNMPARVKDVWEATLPELDEAICNAVDEAIREYVSTYHDEILERFVDVITDSDDEDEDGEFWEDEDEAWRDAKRMLVEELINIRSKGKFETGSGYHFERALLDAMIEEFSE